MSETLLEISVVLDEIDTSEKMKIFLQEIVHGYDVGFGECGVLFPGERDGGDVLFHSPMGEAAMSYQKFSELVQRFVNTSKHFEASHQNLYVAALKAIEKWS